MRGIFLASVAAMSFIAGCTDREQASNRALTRRQQDSVIGQSRLPGAQGVQRSLAAVDSAEARAARRRAIAGGDMQQ